MSSKATSGTDGGLFSIKGVVLVSVMLQNALYTLMRRYSQGVLKESVSSAEVLMVSELFKLIFSAYMTVESKEPSDAHGKRCMKLLWLALNSSKMLVLALIYAAMNVLSFVALRRIDAAAFTVCAQLKILTTAFFSVLVLRRHLTWTKWRALVLIVCASILVSTPSLSSSESRQESDAGCHESPSVDTNSGGGSGSARGLLLVAAPSSAASGEELGGEKENDAGMLGGGGQQAAGSEVVETMIGFGAVLLEVTLSGFASIYFEKVIKATNVKLSIWDRNFQLAMYSILFYTSMILYEASSSPTYVIGTGWSLLSLLVAFLGALGGILVALSVKHTDSIMKSIAVSGAIVLASVGGHAFLGGPMTLPMAVGSVVAIVATQNYTFDAEPSTATSAPGVEAAIAPAMLSKSAAKGSDDDDADARARRHPSELLSGPRKSDVAGADAV